MYSNIFKLLAKQTKGIIMSPQTIKRRALNFFFIFTANFLLASQNYDMTRILWS